MVHHSLLLEFLILSGTAQHVSGASSSVPVVDTSYGSVQGVINEYVDTIITWRGIPFAAAPVDDLRWKAPQNASKWNGTLDASSFGADCAQSYSSAGIFSSGSTDISEDCLFLNIWAPQNFTGQSLPVYLWIYGGRFEGGSGSVVTYEGSGFASKDMVVVTINYRLGPFGFLAHPLLTAESSENTSGNYGVLDMIAALQWVHEEISAFGGDPDHITVGGQSAGSASALDMMWSPLTRNLGVVGVIAESGARGPHDPMTGTAATSYRNFTKAQADGETFLASLNVTTLAEARALSMDTLLASDMSNDDIWVGTDFENSTVFMEPPTWRPTIDGYVLLHKYGVALDTGDHADVAILTGNNNDESGASIGTTYTVASFTSEFKPYIADLWSEFLALYPANNDTQATESANSFFRDLGRVGTWTWASEWRAGGAKSNVFTYYYTHAVPGLESEGTFHGAELYTVFNDIPYSDVDNVTWTADDYAVEGNMSTYWANFIKTSDPNGDGLVNFPATDSNYTVMALGDAYGTRTLADRDKRIAFVQKWMSAQEEW